MFFVVSLMQLVIKVFLYFLKENIINPTYLFIAAIIHQKMSHFEIENWNQTFLYSLLAVTLC